MKNMNDTNANTTNVSPISIDYRDYYYSEYNFHAPGNTEAHATMPLTTPTAIVLQHLMNETGQTCETVASDLIEQAAEICNLNWKGEPAALHAAPVVKDPPIMTHPITLHRAATHAHEVLSKRRDDCHPHSYFLTQLRDKAFVYICDLSHYSGQDEDWIGNELIRQAAKICVIVDDEN